MKTKKHLLSIILILFFYQITNADPIIKIQKCADQKVTEEHVNFLSNWGSLNKFQELIEMHSINMKSHNSIVKILESELSYLEKVDFSKLQNEYSRYISEVPYLKILLGTYSLDVVWDDVSKTEENSSLNKKINSDYFKDYSVTKKKIEDRLKTHKVRLAEEMEEIEKLKSMGKDEYNIKFNETINLKKKNLEDLLKNSIEEKLQNKIYKLYFLKCERERVTAPISFDYNWN